MDGWMIFDLGGRNSHNIERYSTVNIGRWRHIYPNELPEDGSNSWYLQRVTFKKMSEEEILQNVGNGKFA